MKDIAVYTVIMGKFDSLIPVKEEFKDEADFYLFTNLDVTDRGYNVIKINPTNKNLRRESRKYKISYYKYLSQYKYTIYLDGSIEMLISPKEAIKKYLNGADIAAHKHPWRDCIYKEARECWRIGYIGEVNYKRQIEFLRSQKYPEENGLTENGVLIRRNTTDMMRLADLWQRIYDDFTQRDQLSFCYCCWKLNIKYNIIQGIIRKRKDQEPTEFKLHEHL